VLRYTRMLFTQDLKHAFLDELGHGTARETCAPHFHGPGAELHDTGQFRTRT